RAAAAAGIRSIVLVSSTSVYGGTAENEDTPTSPANAYGRSKLAAELVALSLAKEYKIKLAILRMTTLFGRGDRGNVARLIRAVKSRRFVQIGNGTNRKSLIHVSDAARACLVACGRDGIFNVSSASYEMREI